MYRGERASQILAEIERCGFVTVTHLAETIHISPSSIRRDLGELEKRGQIKRSYGGAELAEPRGKAVPFRFRTHEQAAKKRLIARSAVGLIKEGDTIFLDGSSTCLFLAELLIDIKGILVVTNSIDITALLSRYHTRMLCTGGMISEDNRSVLTDDIAEQTLRSLHADIAFFSTRSLDRDGTVSDCYAREVVLRRVMMEQSSRSVLLIDSSKLSRRSTFRQCHVNELTHLICDQPLSDFFLQAPGIDLIHAASPSYGKENKA